MGNNRQLDGFIRKLTYVVIFTALGAAGVAIYIYNIIFDGGLSTDQAVWGQFGDFIGGALNPFFSLLTLIAVLVTLIVQARELSHSTEALKEQSDQLKVQAFENMFFSMLKVSADHVDQIDLGTDEPGEFRGKRAIRKLYEKYDAIYNREKRNSTSNMDHEVIKKSIEIFNTSNKHHIESYLNTFEELCRFIKERAPYDSESYWRILRSQMSVYEILIVLYYLIADKLFININELKATDIFLFVDEDKLVNPDLHKSYLK